MSRRKWIQRTLGLLFCLTLVAAGMTSFAEQPPEQEKERKRLELYAYIESSNNGMNEAWMHKIADTLAATVFLYSDSFDITVIVNRSPQAADQSLISIGSFDVKERQLKRLSEELTGEKIRVTARDNRNLNVAAMRSMLETIQSASQENRALILFSNVSEEYWMADPDIYFLWQSMDLPLGIITSDTLKRPDKDLFQNQIYYLDKADSLSAASIAVDQVRYLGEGRLAVRGIVPVSDGMADGVRLNRRIIAMTENAADAYYNSDSIALWLPGDGENVDLSTASEGWMQFDTLVTGKLTTLGQNGTTFSKSDRIPIRVELFSNGSQRITPTDEWIVSAEIRNDEGKLIQKKSLSALDADAWEGTFEAIDSAGRYQVSASAYHQQLLMNVEVEPDLQIAVRNDAPRRTDKEIETIQLWDWISRYATREINLSDYFTDDSPEANLTYSLVKNIPGYSIEDRNILRIAADSLDTSSSAVEIVAKDQEGKEGQDSLIVRSQRYSLSDVWNLEAKFATSEPVGGYLKNDEVIVQAVVNDLQTVLPEDIARDGWSVMLTISGSDGVDHVNMEEKEQAGSFETKIIKNREGTYTVNATAVCGSWELEPQELGSFHINNTAPSLNDPKQELEGTPLLWKNSLVAINQTEKTMLELSRFFTDDGLTNNGEHPLEFSLKEEKKGVSITSSGRLLLDPEEMETGLNKWTITVRDDENAETDFTMTAQCRDAKAIAEADNAFGLEIQIDQEETYYKDTEIPAVIVFTAGDDFLVYLERLDPDQRKEMLSLISITASGINGLRTGEVSEKEGSKGDYIANLIIPNPRPIGDYTLKATATVQGTAASYSESTHLQIDNRPPVKKENAQELKETLMIPGPLFYNSDMQPKDYIVPIEEQIEYEVLDELTIRLVGMKDGRFIRNSDYWLYTDDKLAASGYDKIQWDTKEQFQGLRIRPTKHQVYHLTMQISDEQQEVVEIPIVLTTVYLNEQNMLYIAIGTVVILLSVIFIIVIRSVTKPCFEADSTIQVETAGVSHTVPTAEWKKQGITLRELLIFSGAPLLGDVSMKACDSVLFVPGRIKHGIGVVIRNNAPEDALSLKLHHLKQNGKTVKVPDGEELEICFAKGQSVKVLSHRAPQN